MSYELNENGFSRLLQARDAIRLLKHACQEARDGGVLEVQLVASYLTLMDEQITVAIDESVGPIS